MIELYETFNQKVQFGDYIVIKKELGSGAFGSVLLGFNINNKKFTALKVQNFNEVLKKTQLDKADFQGYLDGEAKNQMKINCTNVVKLYDHFQNEQWAIHCQEYCNGGTLKDQLYEQPEKRYLEVQAVPIINQILNSYLILFKKNILHRDIKTDNILIHNGVYKLTDFGLSRDINLLSADTDLGTKLYKAPEVDGINTGHNYKIDIYSLGVVFYQLLVGYQATLQWFRDEKKILFPKDLKIKVSDKMKQMITQMLQKSPKNRIELMQLINHTALKQINERSDFTFYDILKDKDISENNQKTDSNKKRIQLQFKQIQYKDSLFIQNNYDNILNAEKYLIEYYMQEIEKLQVLRQFLNGFMQKAFNDKETFDTYVLNYLLLKLLSYGCYLLLDSIQNQDNQIDMDYQFVKIAYQQPDIQKIQQYLETWRETIFYQYHQSLRFCKPYQQSIKHRKQVRELPYYDEFIADFDFMGINENTTNLLQKLLIEYLKNFQKKPIIKGFTETQINFHIIYGYQILSSTGVEKYQGLKQIKYLNLDDIQIKEVKNVVISM